MTNIWIASKRGFKICAIDSGINLFLALLSSPLQHSIDGECILIGSSICDPFLLSLFYVSIFSTAFCLKTSILLFTVKNFNVLLVCVTSGASASTWAIGAKNSNLGSCLFHITLIKKFWDYLVTILAGRRDAKNPDLARNLRGVEQGASKISEKKNFFYYLSWVTAWGKKKVTFL